MRRRESRRRSRHNRTSKSPAMWPGFLAAQIVREYSLLLIFLCKIFPEKLDKARGGRRGILDSPFQSTPPARGGDWGCRASARTDRGHFNPRPPRGGRPSYKTKNSNDKQISIHAPREGGDNLAIVSSHGDYISIHAPREGGDKDGDLDRLQGVISIHAPREGGDAVGVVRLLLLVGISIHAPREGGRRLRGAVEAHAADFNPRPPRGGAT